MKKLYFLSFLFLVSFSFYGQIVNIPDANFKAKLLAALPTNTIAYVGTTAVAIDTNSDGEIQESEAALITKLYVTNASIASLVGLQAFTSLRTLDCSNNSLTSLDTSSLTQLVIFHCSFNTIASLDLTSSVNLYEFYCNNNVLTSLVGLSTSLFWLDCSFNQLTSLDTYTLVNLYNLQCKNNLLQQLVLPHNHSNPYTYASYNQLTSIDLSYIQDLNSLYLDHNNFTTIDFNTPNGIVIIGSSSKLDVSSNPLTSLNISSFRPYSPSNPGEDLRINNTLLTEITLPLPKFKYYYLSNNPNLTFLSVKNQANLNTYTCTDCGYSLCTDCEFIAGNNPLLQTVCIADGPHTYIQNYFSSHPNINLTTYCSFNPGGNFNTLTGTIKLDLESNGCDALDAAANNIPIKIVRSSQTLGNVFTTANGNYTTYSSSTSQTTLTPQFENPYFSVTPASFTSSFSGFGNTATADFCIVPNGVHPDLEVGLIPISPARPGFDAIYKIVYKNKGTTTQSGSVTFNFNDFYSDFVSASSVPNTIQTGLLTWTYANLAPFETREITVVLNLNSPLETPAVNVGDLIIFSAHVTSPATDETDTDNYANLTQVVVGAVDPNDKQVSALSYYHEYADVEDLYYTIRFQNQGTFASENVVVADVLSDKLNDTKLQMVSASHPYISRYNSQTRKLEFIFEGINLPAAINDEPGSHGYVTFKIKPMSTIQTGQTIENKADIYFDFNSPVATNTTSTSIETLLKTDSFDTASFTLHPNPVKNIVNIGIPAGVTIQSISIYNPLGQIVKKLSASDLSSSHAIDVSQLKTGTYFMEIVSNQGKTTKKFVKI